MPHTNCSSYWFLLNLTLNGIQLYLLRRGGGQILPPCKMVLIGCFWLKSTTGCPKKNYTLFWRAVAPLTFELGIKVRGVLEFSGSQL